ncbi:PA3611 family quorum-sensing-regulated virulence factor [Pseudomonas sp. CAU 1711]|uniref:PA3611 family quorum-sensing-regulated virulence factor n=1 Tax=Pseudomonas sp. CAU 1711 TaxID=3140356 RepID=UPI00325FFD82
MPRLSPLLVLALFLPVAQAASPNEPALPTLLQQVARDSSVGTPRAINADILDQGYTAEGDELINHLSVRAAHAEQMRAHPDSMRQQLAASVCANHGYRRLLALGARLRYEFSEYPGNRPVASLAFAKADCGLQ